MGQSDLPVAAGAQHVKALKRAGWTVVRRAQNAHFVLTKAGNPHALSIPDHKEVKRALLQKQIRLAGMTDEQYVVMFNDR